VDADRTVDPADAISEPSGEIAIVEIGASCAAIWSSV
jgi:hypothetical protein